MKRRVIRHYEFVRKIGSGGSGVVFLANDTLLQRPVVLKLLKQGAQTPEQMRVTQLREARLASAIDHPNVCSIYEVGEEDDEAYIVMQYIPGKSLDKVIAEGPASMQLVLSSGIQVADGLQAAHNLGIFHRDLKPANVMLTDGGLIKILDFGLARQLKREQVEFDPSFAGEPLSPALPDATYTARGGTIAYMARSSSSQGQSSVRSDIFALGVLLFELISGRHPLSQARHAGAAKHPRDPIRVAAQAPRDCAGDLGGAGKRDLPLFGKSSPQNASPRQRMFGRRSKQC